VRPRPALILLLAVVAAGVVSPITAPGKAEGVPALYDPSPEHIWNRLHDALFVREAAAGQKYGGDTVDPLLWLHTRFLLKQPSHGNALRVLDEFLATHAERMVQDPVKRAILQHDLWTVFDWTVDREPEDDKDPSYDKEREELQVRLAAVVQRLALAPKEIEELPDNYALAVASGAFAKEYDASHRDRPFLPPDLLDAGGPWVWITSASREPAAIQHVSAFSGRSRFLIFLRLPGGRRATLEYLRALWDFPRPWTSPAAGNTQAQISTELPQFPAGTQAALVRQMTLFDNQGNLVPAPVTESVQIRVYRSISGVKENHLESDDLTALIAATGQDCYESVLSRALLFANRSGGMRAVGREEREFPVFQSRGDDPFDAGLLASLSLRREMMPVYAECAMCHSAGGINSVESRRLLLKPNPFHRESPGGLPARWWENDGTADWKQQRYEWGLLNGYWRAAAGK